jgi:hypothetical protein
VTEGFFKMRTESISFFGFVLTYLVLSRSQAQLPHYIFVVFPLAAILTASHWDKFIWNNQTLSKIVKGLFGFHLFIFIILIIAATLIALVPFGMIHWTGLLVGLVTLGLIAILLFSKQSIGQKWFYIGVVLMLGVNTFMNSHFYPNLLQYQWGNQLAKVMDAKGWDKQKFVLYKIPNSNALHFYGQHVFPNQQDSLLLKEGEWVVTDVANDSTLKLQFPNSVQRYTSNRFHVTMLSLPFLNPKLRKNEITPFEVIELKK